MTSEDVQSQLERHPFKRLRFRLVSGKEIDISAAGEASVLQNSVMIIPDPMIDRLKLVKTDGKSLPIKFRHVLVPMKTFVIVFKGIESATSRFARKGFEEFPYENIASLEPVKSHKRASGKKNGRGHK